jgi:succinate dehydrogenase/fumarate reductase-like Fe-S protein
MKDDAVIMLDPVNLHGDPTTRWRAACRNYIGGNCTVSLHADGRGRRCSRPTWWSG